MEHGKKLSTISKKAENSLLESARDPQIEINWPRSLDEIVRVVLERVVGRPEGGTQCVSTVMYILWCSDNRFIRPHYNTRLRDSFA